MSIMNGVTFNDIMQKLLLWELTTDNQTTRRTSQMRDMMNLHLITYYEKMFEPTKINLKGIIAILIGGLSENVMCKLLDMNKNELKKMLSE